MVYRIIYLNENHHKYYKNVARARNMATQTSLIIFPHTPS